MSKLAACFALVLAALVIAPAVRGEELTVPVVVSPSTINLESQGTWVTVHAEIRYSLVDGASVSLQGIPADRTFADARGELVAKFEFDDQMKEVLNVDGEDITLTLCGATLDGESFSGTDTVRVIRVKGSK